MTRNSAHGGKLIQRSVSSAEREESLLLARSLRKLAIDSWTISDLDCIASGAFSPLEGFMTERDYRSVVHHMRLADGTVWPIPITLAVEPQLARELMVGEKIALIGQSDGETYALLEVEDTYRTHPEEEASHVFQTTDHAHPGVARLWQRPSYAVGGVITLLNRPERNFLQFQLDPMDARQAFQDRGWRTVAGFQTRNPIHRAHEYIQKCAMEMVDGLFLHPLVGETKADDIAADVRMKSYQVLLAKYYPEHRVIMGVFPAAMRYAGPREAIFHALVRKNYGCTHFIVGRDHAGVGSYYGTYAAQEIFQQFSSEELGIVPMCFEHSFYCTECQTSVSSKTCPHDRTSHVTLSGTRVREILRSGQYPPPEITRPEVAEVLMAGMRPTPLLMR
jgi:sulfate adenylyltransferase